jgi:predicted phage tail protein
MKVKLLGELGEKFINEWDLEVSTPSEALRAIAVQCPGFIEYLNDSSERGVLFQVFKGNSTDPIPEDELSNWVGEDIIIITSAIYGGSGNPIINGILGVGLITTAFLIPGGIFSSAFGLIGLSFVRSGISGLLSPSPKKSADPKDDRSLIIDRAAQVTNQGGRVNIPYGEILLTNLIPISSGIVEEQRVDTLDNHALYKRATMLQLPYKAEARYTYSYKFSNKTYRALNTDFLTNRDPYTGMVVDKDPFGKLELNITFSESPTGLNIQSAYALQKIRVFSPVEGYAGANFIEVYSLDDGQGLYNAYLNTNGWTELDLDPLGQFDIARYGYRIVFHQTNTAIPYIAVGELELYGAVGVDENLGNLKA